MSASFLPMICTRSRVVPRLSPGSNTMDGSQRAREQGVAAARSGEGNLDTPFPRMSSDWHAWARGFAWARTRFATRRRQVSTRARYPAHHAGGRPAMVAWPSC